MGDQGSAPLIVAGVDGSPSSAAVLRWALRQAESVGGRVRAVLAWHFPELPGYVPARVESDLSAAAEDVLANLVKESTDGAGADVESVVQEGSAVALLLREARDADLLVLGRHGHGHDGRKLLGAVAHSCVVQAPCPVVVIPPAD